MSLMTQNNDCFDLIYLRAALFSQEGPESCFVIFGTPHFSAGIDLPTNIIWILQSFTFTLLA